MRSGCYGSASRPPGSLLPGRLGALAARPGRTRGRGRPRPGHEMGTMAAAHIGRRGVTPRNPGAPGMTRTCDTRFRKTYRPRGVTRACVSWPPSNPIGHHQAPPSTAPRPQTTPRFAGAPRRHLPHRGPRERREQSGSSSVTPLASPPPMATPPHRRRQARPPTRGTSTQATRLPQNRPHPH